MTYAERIAASRAKYAALIPPIVEAPISPPVEWNILNIKLSHIGKRDYYVPLNHDPDSISTFTHLLHIRQCGANMLTTRHIYSLYKKPNFQGILQDILDTPPIIEGYTPPIIFHSLPDITLAIKTIIKTQIEN